MPKASGHGIVSHVSAKRGTITVDYCDWSKLICDRVCFTDRSVDNLGYPDDLTEVISLGDFVTFSAKWNKRERCWLCNVVEVNRLSGFQHIVVVAKITQVRKKVGTLITVLNGRQQLLNFGESAMVPPPGTPYLAAMPDIFPSGTMVEAKVAVARSNLLMVTSVSRTSGKISGAEGSAIEISANGRWVKDAETQTHSVVDVQAVAAVKWVVSQALVSAATVAELYQSCPRLLGMCFEP